MTTCQPKYSKTDFARRGNEIYENSIRSQVEPINKGKFVAIDIATGTWALDADDYEATQKLLERVPDAQMWLLRVGNTATYRIGGARGSVETK